MVLLLTTLVMDLKGQGNPKGILLKADQIFDPYYAYEYDHHLIPKDLKGRKEYLAGKLIGHQQYQSGNLIFSYRFEMKDAHTFDTNTVEIKATLFNERSEISKQYVLNSTSGVSIYEHQSVKANGVQVNFKRIKEGSFSFIKTLTTMEQLLNSPELKQMEAASLAAPIYKYVFNAKKQLTRFIEFNDSQDTTYVVKFKYSTDERTLTYEYYNTDGSITDQMDVEFLANCFYKATQRKKIKSFKWIKLRNGQEEIMDQYAYIHGADCKIQYEEMGFGGRKYKTVYEVDNSDYWTSKKSYDANGTTLLAFYQRKFNDRGLLTHLSMRFKEDKKNHLFHYTYE
ncbi:MAG TPA: hypothetical protein VL947_09865 [Cytophagales bacterium]|nr:hypothetical protein [Cytophagales bacterium]